MNSTHEEKDNHERLADLAKQVEVANGNLNAIRKSQQLNVELLKVVGRISSSLDLRQALFTIANECRTFIGCDRVSVAVCHGSRFRIEAASGQDFVNRRSNLILALEKLLSAGRVGFVGLNYPADRNLLPDRTEEYLCDVLTASSSVCLVCVPLGQEKGEVEKVHAVLIAETFAGETPESVDLERVGLVAPFASTTIENAIQHQQVFLLPVWKRIGRMKSVIASSRGLKWLLGILLLAVCIAALVLCKTGFRITVTGVLQPAVQRHVFAPADGIVDQVYVGHDTDVSDDQILVSLRSTKMDISIERVAGEMQTAGKRLESIASSLLTATRIGASDRRDQLDSEREEIRTRIESLGQEHKILLSQRESMNVRSRIDGSITTWKPKELLLNRTVRAGDRMLTVAQLDGNWVVDLSVHGARVGHILQAHSKNEPLRISFIPATNPDAKLEGEISKISNTVQTDSNAERMLAVRANVALADNFHPKPGVKVSAVVYCGQRSVGFVWFHEVFEWFQTNVVFYL